jgi:tetratricopeptide (TPR) repeat protein
LKLVAAYALTGHADLALRRISTQLDRSDDHEARKSIYEFVWRFDSLLSALVKQRPDDPQARLAMARRLAERGKQSLAEKQPARAKVELEDARATYARLLSGGNTWAVGLPLEMRAETGARMELQKDGSIFVHQNQSGGGETYTLVFPAPSKGIKGLRLEALADPRLPNGGPGWTPNDGNFVLSELTLEAAPVEGTGRPRAIALRDASADFSQNDYAVRGAIDGDDGTGWAIMPQMHKDHAAVFALVEEVLEDRASRLTVRLVHRKNPGNMLGRFRVSFTDDARTLQATRLRLDLQDGELVDLDVALGRAYAQQGQLDAAADALARARKHPTDHATQARIIAAAAALDGVIEKLAEQAGSDGPFLAELARQLESQRRAPAADAARKQARAWFEQKLREQPDDSASAVELAGLLLEIFDRAARGAAPWTVLKPR